MSHESTISSLSLESPNSNQERDRDQSTVVEEGQFWQEDPWNENLDPNFGRGAAGGQPQGEAPPPPYPGNGQGNAQGNNILNMIEGLLQAQQQQHVAQQQQHNAQMEANVRFQEAHNSLGNEIRQLAIVVERLSQHGHVMRSQPGAAETRTFKPSMFRPLDMKAVTKDNKLLSEEFINWKMNIYRVLRANPAASNLPIQRLTALILAGIGEKAERRLTGLGENPNFNSIEEFFMKLQSIFCSSNIKIDAEDQFYKAKQYPNEDLNGWHSRCLLYFRLAFPTQDYWNLLIKRFFQGMSNRKTCEKTLEHICHRPGGLEALCNLEGYEVCLQLTIESEAFSGYMSSILGDKNFKPHGAQPKTETSIPMDTSSVQNRTYPKGQGQRSSRNTTAFVNQGQRQGPSAAGRQPSAHSGNGTNPPAGMQKKLNQQARNQRTPKDRSQDKCLKCYQIGHWARDCTSEANGSVNATTVIPETKNWSDTSIISSVSNSSKSAHSNNEYDYSRAQNLWPKLTDSPQLRPKYKH